MEIRPGKDNSFGCYGADPNSLLDRPEPVVLNLPNSGERKLRCPFLWQTEAIILRHQYRVPVWYCQAQSASEPRDVNSAIVDIFQENIPKDAVEFFERLDKQFPRCLFAPSAEAYYKR